MNLWSKMLTALRGGMNEAGEAVVDTQALRILDQEVRDASGELKLSKESLVAIIAQQKVAEQKVNTLKASITEYEGYAIKALEKDDDVLALEIAEKIAELENLQVSESEAVDGFSASANSLKAAIASADNNIKRLKQQIDTVKATESVQRAQESVSQRYAGSNTKLQTAMDSLERIKQKQTLNAAKLQAAEELHANTSEQSLQDKLHNAGIANQGQQAKDVLERLKNKQ
ncbi:Phage shock protein A [Oleispira antarctica RB-8]|uniref:Phage shock protein A n=1 Tax=Oleispira antarctica RB-8 TaxID=698738 RepID=R4YQV1_OLEAN|nr:Phage shock protein A [Oleispira antarctica RB-8]